MLLNVVYQFNCQREAEVSYIGETKITRAKEHLSINNESNKIAVKSHVVDCEECKSIVSL